MILPEDYEKLTLQEKIDYWYKQERECHTMRILLLDQLKFESMHNITEAVEQQEARAFEAGTEFMEQRRQRLEPVLPVDPKEPGDEIKK